jgi:sterol desaturase/sphingolipid hydroxylase (fatty acid hydroxylase superfamily)
MLQQQKSRLTSVTRRIVSVLGLVFLFVWSTAVQAQEQVPTERLRCGLLCWIIIIIIIIVIIIIIIRFLKSRR